jgi:hypothetical protein
MEGVTHTHTHTPTPTPTPIPTPIPTPTYSSYYPAVPKNRRQDGHKEEDLRKHIEPAHVGKGLVEHEEQRQVQCRVAHRGVALENRCDSCSKKTLVSW